MSPISALSGSRRSLAIKGEGEDFRRGMVAAYQHMTRVTVRNNAAEASVGTMCFPWATRKPCFFSPPMISARVDWRRACSELNPWERLKVGRSLARLLSELIAQYEPIGPRHTVTNRDFRLFVEATGYQALAERREGIPQNRISQCECGYWFKLN
jgi:hypothetical protein